MGQCMVQGQSISSSPREVYWFVGASYGGRDDQTERFTTEGIWENGYEDRYLDLVREMRPGDRIAIKAAYTRKNGLPFDNRGHVVSTMAIKAVGRVLENFNDGRRLRVDWIKLEAPREWYFYTNRQTVWRVDRDDAVARELIAFAFENKPQNIDLFRNEPYWRERFGDVDNAERRFEWTRFYQAFADKLLEHRADRSELVKGLKKLSARYDWLGYLEDTFEDGSRGFIEDVCPFTVFGIFNRGLKDETRTLLASELAKLVGSKEPAPTAFAGIPVLNNMGSWFFHYTKNGREPQHIEALWSVFAQAIAFADAGDDADTNAFTRAFDDAMALPQVGWKLTFGLYWTRPYSFLSLDQGARTYIEDKLRLVVGRTGPSKRSSASDYLGLMSKLEPLFQNDAYPVHSYPELSLAAWRYQAPAGPQPSAADGDATDETEEGKTVGETPQQIYDVDSILADGCFLSRDELEGLLERLRTKKNVILQGPPGTGKTWLARRLAFALMRRKDESRVRAVQFHQNLSYEDFVRGWRPSSGGSLQLVDGVFLEAVNAALADPSGKVVVVIEEINRGNPAQIFGELLTLLEAGKRNPNEALELSYADRDGRRRPVYIPDNLYVIGTMNIADRSLALVDLALRRRFAFITLESKLNAAWRAWVVAQGVDAALVEDIERRIVDLNTVIADDPRLAKQFQVGHSYVTPTAKLEPGQTKVWFREIVETEIGPLLDEYWFDAPAKAKEARGRLLEGW